MSKLTVHHLGRRLPYDLKIDYEGTDLIMSTDTSFYEATCDIMQVKNEFGLKPYLRPLSQLTEEIEHGGDKFVPVYLLYEMEHTTIERMPYTTSTSTRVTASGSGTGQSTEILRDHLFEDNQYWKIQKLLEWHFVIDEPQGTYIEVNNQNNPYK